MEDFEKLEELIKDDDNIVTVASFAFEAHIPLAQSKEIIEKYVEINKGLRRISITYILNGKRKSEDNLSVSLIKDDALEDERALYEEGVKQITYSIQKAKNVDYNIIALADPLTGNDTKICISGAIIGKNCIKRALRKKVLPTLPPATVKGKSSIFAKQNSGVKSDNLKVEKSENNNQSSKNKGDTKGNIASLFNNVAQNKKPSPKEGKHLEKKQKSNGGLSNFLTKQPSRESQNNDIKKEKQEVKSESKELKLDDVQPSKESKLETQVKKSGLFDSDTDDEILKDLEINEERSVEKEKGSQSKKLDKNTESFDSDTDEPRKVESQPAKKNGKKKEQVKISDNRNKSNQKKKRGKSDVGNDKSAKKRKRIIVEDDSDSDDIFESDKPESEDIGNSDEDMEPVKVEKKPLPPKNKRRKAVEKTYEDEDGYIVTKTEYVYETPSEDENEPDNKVAKVEEPPKPKIEKKGSSNSENDISPNKKAKNKKSTIKKVPSGNQPTLMNFFKKK